MANYARPVYQIEKGEGDGGKERMRRSKKFQEAGGTVKISTTSTYLRGHGPWSLELVEEKGAQGRREISFQRISRRGGGGKGRKKRSRRGRWPARPVETVNGAPA